MPLSSVVTFSGIFTAALLICRLPDVDASSCRSPCRRCIVTSCRGVCSPHPKWRLHAHRCLPTHTCAIYRRCAYGFGKRSCSALARWRLRKYTCSPIHSCGSACQKCVIRRCHLPCKHVAKQLHIRENCTASCDPNCVSGCTLHGDGTCDGNCNVGYTFTSDYTCASCDPDCAGGCDVQGPHRCDQTCNSNFIVDTDTHLCDECDKYCYPTTPGDCSLPGQCNSRCIEGYVINTGHKRCEACSDHCNSCTVAGECDPTSCQFGYAFYGSTMACNPCDSHCTTGCTKAGMCSGNCTSGYGRSNVAVESTCNVCGPNCDPTSGCNARGAGYCDTRCNIGWALSAIHTCEPCQGSPCPDNTDCSTTGPYTCNQTACESAGGKYDTQTFTCGS